MDGGTEMGKNTISLVIDLYYAWQKAREAYFNSVRNLVYRIENNIPFNQPIPKQEIKQRGEYEDKKLFEKLKKIKENASEHDKRYIQRLLNVGTYLKKLEYETRCLCAEFVKETDIWNTFLKDVTGIGEILAAGIIRYFDPEKAKHASSFWRYAGLHVINGKAPMRKKGEKTDYNPNVRTLCWKIADCFIKTKSPYASMYKKEVERQLNKEYPPGYLHKLYPSVYDENDTKLKEWHAKKRARRYIVKKFLADLWAHWRKLKGLPVTEPYSARFHQ